MKILIATHNPAKKNELEQGLKQTMPDCEIVTLNDVGITDEPEETGKTFEANALLKADYYSKKSGLPTIADDGGIMIDALGGEPGVYSKRWMGHDATDQEMIDYTLERMKGVPQDKRSARFIIVLCFIDPQRHHTSIVSDAIEGIISEKQTNTWQRGFPYRAVFKVKECGKYYDELSEKEHHAVNHRFKAISRLARKVQEQYHTSL